MSQFSPIDFKQNIKRAVKTEKIRTIVKKATDLTLSKRRDVVTQIQSWETLRNRGYEIRKKAIENLNVYLKQLEEKFSAKGINLIYAKDANAACKEVLKILKETSAKLVVKSKSMVTEEIGLNEKINEEGIEVVETDLGEYIIQLAGETPSHVTAPAMHKSRDDIGVLFSEKLGLPYTNDPAVLTQYAREILREKFLNADVGISGANFLVAETGTIVIVENEGNARLTTTLPKIHIAITGIEKIVQTLEEVSILLKLLPASSTGQKATSYVSFINSPRRYNESDGPEKIYVILLDNGRRDILNKPEVREALFCIKCGACMNVCPVYQSVGGHAYESVYPGPIGSILTPMMMSFSDSKDLAYGSSLCGACSEICPVKINIHHALLWIRSQSVKKGKTPLKERIIFMLWRKSMQSIFLYKLGTKIFRFLSPLFTGNGKNLKVPIWSEYKDFPQIADMSFREWWKNENK